MELKAVGASYRRWAPVYDQTFGAITRAGRAKAVSHVNARQGKVLEVGVGTGLALRHYKDGVEVTGVDFSPEMLEKARAKVEEQRLSHVTELRRMDARALDFPDDTFDTVVAMYLVSVVPEPEKVVAEMARVCKPGGEVVIVNHFAREDGPLARLERGFAPFADLLGWHSDFPIERVLGSEDLEVVERRDFPPFGMFTFLRLRKRPAEALAEAV
ncbi:class I SAM-dependent methyltransferase [Amaricoccus solimangrovi]|uniref:Methyltransferase domain-containing protein n=1 Tax=Amaricoccus solimangrovi TaxID=2589815 RepID=A0A501WSY5_9RHOB|nr:methyltransferase domain-containing protein [Amaricoccus solimangrovi]TPE52478.1 methyltransferase domain-containing protein [Amaricoccus solimangrovi]